MTHHADLLNSLKIDRKAAPPPSRTPLWIALATAGVLLLGGGAWFAFGRDAGIEVHTAQATVIDGAGSSSASVLDATGYIVARRMATVSAKVTGRVREVLIEEGQRVQAGEVLARLDPVDANAQRALAASQLAAARSQIHGVQAQLTQAEAEAQRLSSLVDKQLVSRAQFDQAIAQRDALRAGLTTAQRNAQVADDALQIASNGVDNTIVRAPFAGVVIAKSAQPGEIVSPLSAGGGFTRTGIGTIVDMDSLEAEVEVGESFIARVKPNMPTETVLNAYQDWKIPGHVIAIIPAADRGKATVKVRVALDAKGDPRLVPEMGARVSFLEASQPAQANTKPGVLIPSAALVNRNDHDAVFVLNGDAVHLREVKIGRSLGDDREVLTGLSGGEQLVIDAPAQLADGAQVRVARENTPSAANE